MYYCEYSLYIEFNLSSSFLSFLNMTVDSQLIAVRTLQEIIFYEGNCRNGADVCWHDFVGDIDALVYS